MKFDDSFIVPVRRYLSSLYNANQAQPYYLHVFSSLKSVVEFDIYGVLVFSLSDNTKSLFIGDPHFVSEKEDLQIVAGRQTSVSADRKTCVFVLNFNGYRIKLFLGRNMIENPGFSVEDERIGWLFQLQKLDAVNSCYSKDELALFSFLTGILNDAIVLAMEKPVPGEAVAGLSAKGTVLHAGLQIRHALEELFGPNNWYNPGGAAGPASAALFLKHAATVKLQKHWALVFPLLKDTCLPFTKKSESGPEPSCFRAISCNKRLTTLLSLLMPVS